METATEPQTTERPPVISQDYEVIMYLPIKDGAAHERKRHIVAATDADIACCKTRALLRAIDRPAPINIRAKPIAGAHREYP